MSAEALLRLRAVRVDRGRRTILHDLDLDIAPGAVVGLIGPNGSGKTTLLSAIGAGTAVAAGQILFGEKDLTSLRPRHRARYVSFVPQQTGLTFDLTVREIVALGTIVTGHANSRDELVAAAIESAGCAHLADRPASRLSGGEGQLVQIARALAQNAPVLVMDEPISALDIAHQLTVLTLARAQADRVDCGRGRAVVASLHDIDLAARFCDHLVLMQSGRIVATGTPDEVLEAELLARVYGVHIGTCRDEITGTLRVTALPASSPITPCP
ncbi:ATP-binding cassette domain-containing protein [Rhodococcus sp. ABRD24]|uniref:ABC transporter ATP-binding protein n=1 Tax=Rhodococcus sp. ABRD24 TaxID=2507582 RepID=UPI00103AD757|nr:ATP-binding cassette domain-containing protein [Rhodococcus sp. ABRD24]QBJ96860.1 ATP-binding cassette domain-containing protein [Rhodococcus sp. ABRD24]